MTDNQHYLYTPHEDSVQMQILHPNTAEEDVLGLRQWRLMSELTAELHGASRAFFNRTGKLARRLWSRATSRRTETMLWREREDERLQNYFRRLEQIRGLRRQIFCFIKEDEDEEFIKSDNDDEEDEESGSDGDTEDNEEDVWDDEKMKKTKKTKKKRRKRRKRRRRRQWATG